ncbi:NAD(P)H-hydrate dehydratase [Terrihabitans sp. B22-R8]|uniref:NAD(P)H-hydrate dehydratase n=1 Tax=Terrihabitans sp. B22-R8 TaxID=3425128 RepID=UPI00403C423D
MSRPQPLDAELLRTLPLPEPQEGSKEDRGRVLIVGGSRDVPGAALLAGLGALRSGAGKLQIATAASRAAALGLAMPEALVMELPENGHGGFAPEAMQVLSEKITRCDALVIGPGMREDADADALTAGLLRAAPGLPFVLDAAALCGLMAMVDDMRSRPMPPIITPHAGEMANLLGIPREEIEADPVIAARKVADTLGAVVVMKGSTTRIVDAQGGDWLYTGGSVGLGTSGSGDTLAGIIGGLLARGAAPAQAALWGVFLHGEAGRRLAHSVGKLGFLAREIPDRVPAIMDEFPTI